MVRAVSLLPSATETICALGLADQLVGRSHECDYPASISHLPACTESRLPPGDSAAVDRSIRGILQQALSVYRVDPERLRQLAPDLIVTQTQCEVCAVSPRAVEEALAGWLGARPKILAVQPDDLSAACRDIRAIARSLDAEPAGERLVRSLQERMRAIQAIATNRSRRPKVALIEWIEPLMSAGNWMPELVAMAGGENLFGTAGAHSPWLDWTAVVAADPDIILVHPCGWNMDQAQSEMHFLTTRPDWPELQAVRNGQVYLADGNQYFNRPGPRLAETLEILAEVLHPGAFDFGHQGNGWRRFS